MTWRPDEQLRCKDYVLAFDDILNILKLSRPNICFQINIDSKFIEERRCLKCDSCFCAPPQPKKWADVCMLTLNLAISYLSHQKASPRVFMRLFMRGWVLCLSTLPLYTCSHLPQRTASMHWPLDLSSRRVGTRFGLTCTRLSYLLLPVPTRGWPPLLPPPPIEPWVPPSFTLLRLQLTTNQPLKTTQPLFCNFSKAGWALSVCHHWVPQLGFKWRMRYCSDSFSGWALLILIRQQRE